MATHALHYLGQVVSCHEGETVLAAFLRAGVEVSFSCKSGVCHRCAMKCLDGQPPIKSRHTLPTHLQDAGYFLSCQCEVTGPMVLAPKSAEDMVVHCILLETRTMPDGVLHITFDTATIFENKIGQSACMVAELPNKEIQLIFLNAAVEGQAVQAELHLEPGQTTPAWLLNADASGTEFSIRGPFPVETSSEATPLPPSPDMWVQIGGDAVVRGVLECFYRKVYADPILRPFFERVTMDWVIGKQFAFMKQSITGEEVFLGERPRNSHHWMVISDKLFDHRQTLMMQALRQSNLSDGMIAQWTRLEEHYRPDIVKHRPWPKRIGDLEIDTERYDSVVLDEGTACDYCMGEIAAHTLVRYHRRLGHVACAECSGSRLINSEFA